MFLQICLRTLEIVIGPKRSLVAQMSLLLPPWMFALLLLHLVYNIRGIPLPKRLPSNARLRPPIS